MKAVEAGQSTKKKGIFRVGIVVGGRGRKSKRNGGRKEGKVGG